MARPGRKRSTDSQSKCTQANAMAKLSGLHFTYHMVSEESTRINVNCGISAWPSVTDEAVPTSTQRWEISREATRYAGHKQPKHPAKPIPRTGFRFTQNVLEVNCATQQPFYAARVRESHLSSLLTGRFKSTKVSGFQLTDMVLNKLCDRIVHIWKYK